MNKKNISMLAIILALSLSFFPPGFLKAAVRPDSAIHSDLKALFEHPPAVSGYPFEELIAKASEQYGLPAAFILAVARGESFFDPNARSHKGALGLMQVMPATAAEYGVGANELMDPARNIDVGVHYLADLYEMLQDPYLALAAYYCGPGKIDKNNFELGSDCNEYVHYIHAHLKKVLTQIPASYASASTASFILARFDNYLDARAFIKFMGGQLPGADWDVLRKELRMQDHARYYYRIVVSPAPGQDKSAFCREVEKKTGFYLCSR
jgi:membrane-bound lytic murein transglycosylase MltF